MKRARILQVIGLLALACLALAAIIILNDFKRFDLSSNPIVSEIRNDPSARRWGDRVALIPAQFQKDGTRETVLRKLETAGFAEAPESGASGLYQDEINLGREVFTREANRFPCNIRVYVVLEFDDADRLIFAQGAQHEHGCL